MSDTIVIRRFQTGYTIAVQEMVLPIQQEEFGIDIKLDQQPDLCDIQSYFHRGNGGFWIACDGESVVGSVGALDIGGGHLALKKMFVKSEYRGEGKGVARKLLGTVISHARERGVACIYLGTTPQLKAAHRFYEKNGFVEIQRSELPEAFPIVIVDTKFYRKYLL